MTRSPAAGHAFAVPRELLARLDTTGPRYTSYPTAPEWREPILADEVRGIVAENQRLRGVAALSLYVHIPFCHHLCWYCACNMVVARRPEVADRYLDALELELSRVAAALTRVGGIDRPVVQIHWGGGTPTFLSPAQLERLFAALRARFRIAEGAELSIEVHPPVTTREQLATLARLGFNRLSMGVQDFDPAVQRAVHRPQPYEQTAELVAAARELGFASINVDLMYGLPRQSIAGFERTLALVGTLRPERLALFNYAHVPWLRPAQKLIKLAELPSPEAKLDLLERAIAELLGRGYAYIGMDHFALPTSELARAQADGSLRRNFMGYTTCADSDLYGFGVSSISDLDGAYLQNARALDDYYADLEAGGLAVRRGLVLSADDRLRRDLIQSLACYGRIDTGALAARHGVDFDGYFADELVRLQSFVEDGVVTRGPGLIEVTPRGRLVLRNVCMVFDAYLRRAGAHRRYSKTI